MVVTLKHMLMGFPEYPEGPNSPMDSEIILNCDRTNGKDQKPSPAGFQPNLQELA